MPPRRAKCGDWLAMYRAGVYKGSYRAADLHVFGKARYQRLFRALHRLSLAGLNFGNPSPATNGEFWLLDELARRWSGRRAVVFDVGAHTGAYAREALRRFDVIDLHCFEPSGIAFEQLVVNMSNPRVHLHPFGLGDRNGEAELFGVRQTLELSSIYRRDLRHIGLTMEHQETILLCRLDDFCAKEGIGLIDLLKLDVEGGELAVLRGAEKMLSRKAIQVIVFEFGGTDIDAGNYLRDFFHLLEPAYEIKRLLRNGVLPLTHYSEHEEIFDYCNYVASVRAS